MRVKRKTDDYLAHHGIKGQRWGVRRYQNKDGTLTAAGRKRLQTIANSTDSAYVYEKTNNFIEDSTYDINKNQSISDAYNTYKKDTQLLTDAKSAYYDKKQYKKEQEDFNNNLKKSGINYTNEQLEYSFIQQYCLNRGVNPITYKKTCETANKKYMNSIKSEVDRLLGEVGNQKLSAMTGGDRTISDYLSITIRANKRKNDDMPDAYGIFEYDMLEPQYAEDKEIFEKIIKTVKSNK